MVSQNGIITNSNITPSGSFDTIFDSKGNTYNVSEIKHQAYRVLNNGAISTTTLTVDAGYFRLYFESGSGMEGSSSTDIARRTVLIQVFQDISNFIISPLTTNGLNNKVNIWVRNFVNMPNNIPSNISKATSLYSIPNSDSNYINYGGIVDNEIWKTIHLGKDSYTNVAPGIISLFPSNLFTVNSLLYHGIIGFNFNTINWNVNSNVLANTIQYDLYTDALHQITHLLGFESLISFYANSLFNNYGSFFNRYDTFLKMSNNVSILSSLSTCTTMYDNKCVSNTYNAIHPDLSNCQPNTTNCLTAVNFVGTNLSANISVPIYTPNCWENYSSLSHFEDSCFTAPIGFTSGNDLYFTMSNLNSIGTNNRYLKNEERLALVNLGYSVSSTYGNSATVNGFIPNNNIYGSNSISGITVAGINDGLTNEGSYLYIGNTGQPIVINSATNAVKRILFNDINATGFECLQDITDVNATISFSSGTTMTETTITSNVSGLHILRYVPINTSGKGNITYVYVYIYPNSTATSSTCSFNLVKNGNFEQYFSLPTVNSQIERAKSWQNINTSTPDYYNEFSDNATFVSVPCNFVGYETDKIIGNKAYAGFVFYKNLDNTYKSMEIIKTKLASPLLPNTSYQLSFDVSLAEMIKYATNLQAYLSKDDYYMAFDEGSIPILNSSMLFSNSSISTIRNGWQTITFNFTTNNVAGEQFLYLGHFIDVQNTLISPSPLGVNGCTNYTLNELNSAYYYVDNVSLVNLMALNGATFNPISWCSSQTIPNLTTYLTSCPINGIFTGNGVSFNSNTGIYSFQFPNGVTTAAVSYTFTSSLGCPLTINSTITATNLITPTFTSIPVLCQGSTPPAQPATSLNGITGTWSPATISTSASGNYTFTPNAGQCANPISRAVQVLSNNAFVANADIFTVTLGTSITTPVPTLSVLYNDTYNGGQAPTPTATAITGIPYSIVQIGASPSIPLGGIAFNTTTGIFTVQPNTTAGTYNYQYRLQNNCYYTTTKTIKIIVNRITVAPRIQFVFCYNTTSSSSSTTSTGQNTTLFQGTTISYFVPANGTNATIQLVAPTTTLPAGITQLTTNGTFTVNQGTLPGSIFLFYRICSNGTCSGTIMADITISPTILVTNDSISTAPNGSLNYNVLSNDAYKGACGSLGLVPATVGPGGNVVLTQLAPFSSNYSISPTGAIQFNNFLSPGSTVLLNYQLCDVIYPSLCVNRTVVIIVPNARMSNTNNSNLVDLKKMIIVPNPTCDIVNIMFNQELPNSCKVSVYDLLGRLLIEKNTSFNDNFTTVDLSDYAQGNYLIKIKDELTLSEICKKIIKK